MDGRNEGPTDANHERKVGSSESGREASEEGAGIVVCPHCGQNLTSSEVGHLLRASRRKKAGSRLDGMTPAQRSAEAQRMAQVRWAKGQA